MSLMPGSLSKQLRIYGGLLCVLVLALICCVHARRTLASEPDRVGFPWDWSNQHVVFSNTTDVEVLALVRKDPRAFHQWLRRNPALFRQVADGALPPVSLDAFMQSRDNPRAELRAPEPRLEPWPWRWLRTKPFERDWGASLGKTNFSNVNANKPSPLYPAKYTFNINATPSCSNDYVVFPTGAQSMTSNNVMNPNGQAAIIGFKNLYSTQTGSPGGFCNHNGPTVAWAYINAACPATMSNDAISSSPVISLDGTKVAWVTAGANVQILTIGSGGGTEAALAPVCIGSAMSGGDGASLQQVQLTNAHSPNGTKASLSEIFVDYNSDSAYIGDDDGYLHKISPFFTATGAIQEVSTPSWVASHAYSTGTLIVDSNGFIEQCTTAGTSNMGGHPGWATTVGATTMDGTVIWTNEGSGGGWPVYVTGTSAHQDNNMLSAPVFDFVSKNVFIGDQNGSLYYVLDPGTSTAVGSCANSATLYPCLGKSGTSGITANGNQMDCVTATPNPTCMVMSNHEGFTDPVVVDSANQLVIAQFSDADDMTLKNAAVEQTNTSLSVFNSTTLAPKGNLSYHSGAFDNNYYSNPTTGFFYVCGPDSTGSVTDLYRVGFTSTSGTIALGAVNGTPLQITTAGNTGNCSALTEIFNTSTSTDWLFLSVDNHGVTAACANQSCVMSFTLGTSMVTAPSASYDGPSGANMNGSGGFIVDNVANTTTFSQASSIYFMPIANNLTCGDGSSGVGCGIKLTQSGLN
jgi:hypothetical protein